MDLALDHQLTDRLDWRDLAPNRDLLVSFLTTRCRDPHEAEDLTQEALLRAARFRSSQREPGRLRSWLFRIAANLHRDHVRRETKWATVPFDDPLFEDLEAEVRDDVEVVRTLTVDGDEHDLGDVIGALNRSWGGLSERDRRVLGAFYGEAGSAAAAATAAAIPRGNVKVCLHRARRRLEARIRRELSVASLTRVTPRRCSAQLAENATSTAKSARV